MTGMQKNRKVWMVGVSLFVGWACHADTEYKLERYNVILDRSPFGSDPLSSVTAPDASAKERATAAALEKAYRLSFLLETDEGEIRAGFQNLKPKPGEPASSVIMVGESFMGMKLKTIDMVNSEATLEHNGQPITFQLTKRPVQAKASVRTPTQPTRRFGGGFRSREPAKPAPTPPPKLSPEEQKLRREEIRKNLQDYQMEVIRTGMPPLPVPLTKEMDDQLVAEGVLPAAEE
ncbi:MAG: hypothetical protein KAU94_04460 [Verrucomicrobia bacterium]|nr:hypothetical protein [Verrucomicrobiota bacterium]